MKYYLSILLLFFALMITKAQYNFTYAEVVSLMNYKKSSQIISKFKLSSISKEKYSEKFLIKIDDLNYNMEISVDPGDVLYSITFLNVTQNLSSEDYKQLYKKIYNNLLKCEFQKEHYNTFYYKNEEFNIDMAKFDKHPNDENTRFLSVFFKPNISDKQFWLELEKSNILKIQIHYTEY